MNTNVKSATVAGLLGIFLGSFGAHNWYLGQKKKGIIHICLALSGVIVLIIADVIMPMTLSFSAAITMAGVILALSGFSTLLMSVNGLWGLIEGIIILAKGDAGLAAQGYAVAGGVQNYGYQNMQQPMQQPMQQSMQQMPQQPMNQPMTGQPMQQPQQPMQQNNGFGNEQNGQF